MDPVMSYDMLRWFQSAPFVLFTAMFVAGIGIAWQWSLNPYLLGLVGMAGLLGLLSTIASRSLLPWLFAGVMVLSLGAGRYWLSAPNQMADPLFAQHGQHLVMEGLVADEPDVRDRYVNLRVQVARTIAHGQVLSLPTGPFVQVRAARDLPWRYGDQIRVYGEVDAPPVMAEFSYRDYLARKGVFTWVPQPERIELLAQDQGNWAYAQLLRAKAALRLSSQQVMPAPESALLNGILIGDDNEIPPAIVAAFRATGTSHIVSISGFNVSIVISMVVPVLGRLLNKRRAALIAIPAIFIYMLLTGASASVVRAAVMAILSLLGQLLWRRGFTLNTLCAAALIMLAIDPETLFDGGFQLSFMATLGLVLYANRLTSGTQQALTRLVSLTRAEKLSALLADVFLVTLSAQITTLPILLANFRQLSLISLLANAIVLPLQPAAMILGMVGSGAGILAPGLGRWVSLPAYALLTATLRIVEVLAQVPGATIPIYSFGALGLTAYYAGLAMITGWLSLSQAARKTVQQTLQARVRLSALLMPLTIAAIIGGVYWYQRPDGQLHVVFAGNSVFIQTPQGKQIVVGGGNGVLGVMGRAMPLWDQQIELLVQPERNDRQRSNMLPLLQRYRTERLLIPWGNADEPSPTLSQWQTMLTGSVNQVISASVGVPVQLEPDLILMVTDQQDGALAFRLSYGELIFDLPASLPLSDKTLVPNSIAFLDPRFSHWNELKKANPRWLIWSDLAVMPVVPRLFSNHSVSMRNINTLEMISDGKQLTVMQR